MAGRTIAIGDIHGCAVAFRALVELIQPVPADRLVVLGDYVDRGPDSRGVIETIFALRKRCELVPLLGNHELMMLNALKDPRQRPFWLNYGGQQTIASYGEGIEDIPPTHIEFLKDCLRGYETASHLFLHANYLADLALDEQPESIALWTHLTQHLPNPHVSGKVAVVGHTPQPSGHVMDLGHLICIDTFCCGGCWLSAIDVDDRQVWQARENGETRSEILSEA
jgi:serine/threonine protein phosphatase 1